MFLWHEESVLWWPRKLHRGLRHEILAFLHVCVHWVGIRPLLMWAAVLAASSGGKGPMTTPTGTGLLLLDCSGSMVHAFRRTAPD